MKKNRVRSQHRYQILSLFYANIFCPQMSVNCISPRPRIWGAHSLESLCCFLLTISSNIIIPFLRNRLSHKPQLWILIIIILHPVYVLKSIKINSVNVHCKNSTDLYSFQECPLSLSLTVILPTNTHTALIPNYICGYMHILLKTQECIIYRSMHIWDLLF